MTTHSAATLVDGLAAEPDARAVDAPSRLRDHKLLLALTVIGPLCEAVPLRYFRITAGLAPQLTAPSPFGIYHDLRWVAVFNTNWWSFALEIGALVVFRATLTAAIVRAAWPRNLRPPSFRTAWRVASAYTVVAAAVLAPWATFAFAAGATSLSWFTFASLPTFLLFALALSHGGVRSCWAHLPTPKTIAWTAATFIELDLAAAAIVLGPWWLAWCSAALAGLFNAWAWRGLVGTLAERRAPTRRWPVVPLVLAALFVVIAIGVAVRVGWSTGRVVPRAGRFPSGLHGRTAILLTHGFDSSWKGSAPGIAVGHQFYVSVFSYAGTAPDGSPLPYGTDATHASLAHLDAVMDAQVRALARVTGQPVRILAVSEGGLVARSYVQTYAGAPVSQLIMASALIEPGRVYYPSRGRTGWGFASGWGMRGLAHVVQAITGVRLDPDMAFLRSVVDYAPALRTGMLCPAPHTRVALTVPIASAASIPPTGTPARVPVDVVPALHGDDVDRAAQIIIRDGRTRVTSTPGLGMLNHVLRAAATAWMVPELPVSLNDRWSRPIVDRNGCPVTGWP